MRKIKQLISVVAAIFAVTTFSYAQSYALSPNDTVIVNGLMEDLQTLVINQLNTSSDTLNLEWQKVSESVPPLWEASVCDNQLCYTTLENNGVMNPILPAEYGFILLHITAHVNYGTAVIRYAVWDRNTPNQKDTLTFIMNLDPTGIATSTVEEPKIWLSENKINLQNINQEYSSLSISELSGKEIFKANINSKEVIDLPILPTAIYIVQLSATISSKHGKRGQFHQKIFYQQ